MLPYSNLGASGYNFDCSTIHETLDSERSACFDDADLSMVTKVIPVDQGIHSGEVKHHYIHRSRGNTASGSHVGSVHSSSLGVYCV